MTPLLCCGFECGVGGPHWTLANANASFSTATKRTGQRSLRINGSQASSIISASGKNKFVVRFYIYFVNQPANGNFIFLSLMGGSGWQNGIRYNSSTDTLNIILIDPTGAPSSTATGPAIILGRWLRVDYLIDTSANPWIQKIKIDGNEIVNNSLSTTAATFGGTSLIIFGNSTSHSDEFFVDDFIYSETSADFPFGAGMVQNYVPTSDGAHNIAGTGDFQRTLTGTDILNATTTAFQLIDDIPLESGASVDWINMVAPPNATDYVECVFGPAPGTPTPTYGPRAVEVIAGIHQAATGNGNMEIRINDNGTTDAMYSATGAAGVTSVAYKRKHYATAINGGGAWGVASGVGNFNNLRVRFGSPAAVDANPDQYLDCIMIEAEFAEWPQKIVNIKQAINRAATY